MEYIDLMKTKTHVSPFRKTSARRITGQGMTEYIIVLALIALAAVVVVGYFGDTVQAQFTAMGQKLSGETGTDAIGKGKTAIDKGNNIIDAEETLKTYAD